MTKLSYSATTETWRQVIMTKLSYFATTETWRQVTMTKLSYSATTETCRQVTMTKLPYAGMTETWRQTVRENPVTTRSLHVDVRIIDGGSEGGAVTRLEWQRRSPDVAADVSREKNYNKKRTAPEKRILTYTTTHKENEKHERFRSSVFYRTQNLYCLWIT